MKIDYAIVSCNNNIAYYQYWKYVKNAWLKLGITPILAYVADDIHLYKFHEQNSSAIVMQYKPIHTIPIHFQAQWLRFHVTQEETLKDKVCIISDIDMIPLSRWYFVEQIQDFSNDKYIHLNPCIEEYGRLPVCYHVAKGSTFKEVLELDTDFETSCKKVYNTHFDNSFGNNVDKWGNDEEYTTNKILKYNSINQGVFVPLDRFGGANSHRVDRNNWNIDYTLASQKHYYDAHCGRDLHLYEKDIQTLINFI